MIRIIYIICTVLSVIVGLGFFYRHYRHKVKKRSTMNVRLEPRIAPSSSVCLVAPDLKKACFQEELSENSPVYDPNIIILQIQASPGKPYMGYELLQTLLSVGLEFGESNIFHRKEFSVAAATPEGSFPFDDMGSFKCFGLIVFMKLEPKKKLMASFDLMLDTARQLIEELGGEIYDDQRLQMNASVIRKMREKICTIETSNLYVADLLDNL